MRKIIFSFIILICIITLNFNIADAGDRKILIERFTSSTCVPCRIYNPTLEAFLNSADPEKVTNISYHMSWPSPGNDPMYHINPSDNDARRTRYGVNAIPDWYLDGNTRIQIDNSIPITAANLQNAFDNRTNVLSPVTIVVTDNISGSTVNVKADVYCEGLLTNPNVNIYFVVIEKIVYYNGTNGETNYTYVMRKLLPSSIGYPTVLLPGNKITLEYSYEMNGAWNPAMISNTVFVQSTSNEILNTATPTANFNLVSQPGFRVVNQGQSGSGSYELKIPVVAAGYTSPVSFTHEVIPANAGISVSYPTGNTISSFPGTANVNVTSTAGVPTGEYQIVFTGTNTSGKTHKTIVNYLVGKNYISVGNTRPSLTFKVDNVPYISSRAFLWDLNSTHTIEAVSPQTIGNTRFVFSNWSNGGPQLQTISIGTLISDYRANYNVQYRMLGSVEPAGLPVTVSNSGGYLDSGTVNQITVSAQQVQFNGKTYYFNRWEGLGNGSYTGTNQIAEITMYGFISQKAFYDTVDVGISNYNSSIPDKFALYQNYPNPFNPSTLIKFDIASSSAASLIVYDLLGQEIESLVDQVLAPGTYQYSFNASKYPSGIYYYRIKTDEFTEVRKMIYLK